MKISKMAGLATLAYLVFWTAAWAAETVGEQKQPTADLFSQIVRAGDVKPKLSAWGETRQHFQGADLCHGEHLHRYGLGPPRQIQSPVSSSC
jgi:hypothetical protein